MLEDTQCSQPALDIVYVRPDILRACDEETEALISSLYWKIVEIHTSGKPLLIIVTLSMMKNLPSGLKRCIRTDSRSEICPDSKISRNSRSSLRTYHQRLTQGARPSRAAEGCVRACLSAACHPPRWERATGRHLKYAYQLCQRVAVATKSCTLNVEISYSYSNTCVLPTAVPCLDHLDQC